MNQKAKQISYIMAMVGAGLLMIGYAMRGKVGSIGTYILVLGAVILAVGAGFLLSARQYKYCPKCSLKVTASYIKQNTKHFGKYKCPRCSCRQTPQDTPPNTK